MNLRSITVLAAAAAVLVLASCRQAEEKKAAEGPAPIEYSFDADAEGFAKDSGYGEGSAAWNAGSASEGVLRVTRGAASAKTPIVLFTNSSPINITGRTIVLKVKISQAYITEGTMGIKMFFKNSDWTYFGSWTGVNNGTITAGYNTISLAVGNPNFSLDGAGTTFPTSSDSNTVYAVGVEFDPNNGTSSVTDDIDIDSITIE